MAKSIRSKWKRKCRAIKRERYGKKELDRLKKTLGIEEGKSRDIDMSEISEIATIKDAETLKQESSVQSAAVEEMESDERKFNLRTLRDQHGTYPVWVHPRKISKNKKGKIKKQAKIKKKQVKIKAKAKKGRK